MAIQVDESEADELGHGHVYSEGERLLCRIRLCRERQKQTQEYSRECRGNLKYKKFSKTGKIIKETYQIGKSKKMGEIRKLYAHNQNV